MSSTRPNPPIEVHVRPVSLDERMEPYVPMKNVDELSEAKA
jgi:hypothetical protein